MEKTITEKEQNWTAVIKPKNRVFDLKLKELWRYKDLIWLFVKRDFVTKYKQTVLGPLWFIIQPLFTTIMHNIVFGNFAGLDTDGLPSFLFYLGSNLPWLYFSTCLTSTSNTFVSNSGVFGKVYFPRLTTPISTSITCMINFGIQFVLFLGVEAYFFLFTDAAFKITIYALLTPVLLLQMALLGMGFGIVISSLTTKYRDLQVLVSFGVSLWMYATPVVYTANSLSEKAYSLVMLNPMSPITELFRMGWMGAGNVNWFYWGISWVVTLTVLFFGVILFNKVEKTFMDTV